MEVEPHVLDLLCGHSIGRYPEVLALHIIRSVSILVVKSIVIASPEPTKLVVGVSVSLRFFSLQLIGVDLIMVQGHQRFQNLLEDVIAIHEYVGCLRLRDAFQEMLHELAPLGLVDFRHGENACVASGLSEYTEYVRDKPWSLFIGLGPMCTLNRFSRVGHDNIVRLLVKNLLDFLEEFLEVSLGAFHSNLDLRLVLVAGLFHFLLSHTHSLFGG